MVDTLQWLKGLSNAKCAFIGPLVAADGLSTSAFVTAEPIMCTSCLQRLSAVCVTVATGSKILILIKLYLFRRCTYNYQRPGRRVKLFNVVKLNITLALTFIYLFVYIK